MLRNRRMKKILLLGHTGKMGLALQKILAPAYQLIGLNSRNFDAADFDQVAELIGEHAPELIINALAFQGIDQCEASPEKAFRLNTLFPGHLARLADESGKTLIHFSTDSVFSDYYDGPITEADAPSPLNVYGVTKYGGEALVRSRCERHYILRLPLLFGESLNHRQFVESMLQRIRSGAAELRIADDIVSSPSYSLDIAVRLREMLAGGAEFGTYHIASEGAASLFELMEEIVFAMNFTTSLRRASYEDFPHIGRKNRHTPLASVKLPPLRPWQEAVRDYCEKLKEQ